MVNNVLHTVSNAPKVRVLLAELRRDFRLPHEDQDKEDVSGLVNRCLRLRTLTQKSTGREKAGLELRFRSSCMDTGKVKRLKKIGGLGRIDRHSTELAALFGTLCALNRVTRRDVCLAAF